MMITGFMWSLLVGIVAAALTLIRVLMLRAEWSTGVATLMMLMVIGLSLVSVRLV